ncbi:MAG: hypothetical protein ACRCU2_19075, partial [Planktothrix sp.]
HLSDEQRNQRRSLFPTRHLSDNSDKTPEALTRPDNSQTRQLSDKSDNPTNPPPSNRPPETPD